MRIMLLEDDLDVLEAVEVGLHTSGFAVDPASNMVDAQLLVAANTYDCFVLDRTVPGGDSLDQLAQWRAAGVTTPALFLTALDSVADRVAGFEIGGDDYLGKPFAVAELIARVQRLCRQQTVPTPVVLELGDLSLDTARRTVERSGIRLILTAKEFAVLEQLMSNTDRVVTKEHLMESCWDERTDPRSNTIEVHIGSLRKKLGEPALIHTERGSGYRASLDT